MSARIFVTGGSGYLGEAVLLHLAKERRSVRALVRKRSSFRTDGLGDVEVVVGDLSDRARLASAMKGSKAVLHLAGLTADWWPDRAEFVRANDEGSRNLLLAAEDAGVERVVLTSTVMVLGPTDGLAVGDERTRPPPGSFTLPYQATKAMALSHGETARARGLDVVIVYPGALYGSGPLTEGNYLTRVMSCLRNGQYPVLPRMHGQRWCLAHVEDVAQGHRLALDLGKRNGDYVLGGENIAFDHMLDIIRDGLRLNRLPRRVPGSAMIFGLYALCTFHGLFGSRPPISVGGAKAMLSDWAFSSARAERELGYQIRPFADSFASFVRWYASVAPSWKHDA